jgi:large subunit ribosomal protein L13
MFRQKTTQTTKEDAQRGWVLVDLENKVLGRAASEIAKILRGKHKGAYVPHLDNGDFVIAVNASKIALTGSKWDNKISRRHTGYAGGLKEQTAREVMDRHPDQLIKDAVWGMLPKNTSLSKRLMTKFKVYPGAEHPHEAQNPQKIEI